MNNQLTIQVLILASSIDPDAWICDCLIHPVTAHRHGPLHVAATAPSSNADLTDATSVYSTYLARDAVGVGIAVRKTSA